MSSVMARTPTVTRHSDFMAAAVAAAAAAEQGPPGLAGLGLRGRAHGEPRPTAPGGAGSSQRLPAPRHRSRRRSPGDALLLPGMLFSRGMVSRLTGAGTTYPKAPGDGSCPQGFLAQPEASCPPGMALLERLARCGGQRQGAFWKTIGIIGGKLAGSVMRL